MSDIEKMTKKSQEAMKAAAEQAERLRNTTVEPEHLLWALLSDPEGLIPQLLGRLQVEQGPLLSSLEEKMAAFSKVTSGEVKTYPSPRLVQVFKGAEREAKGFGDSYISTEHFLLSMLKGDDQELKSLFRTHGVELAPFEQVLTQVRGSQKVTDDSPESKYDALSKYGRDLTELASQGKLDPVVGREEEIRRTIQVLARRKKNNPVLIGEPGVGKTAIAEGLALRIANGDVPEVLLGKKLVSLDLAALLAGAKYRGEFEDRLKAVIKEVTDSDGEVLIFIDELHTLVGAGRTDGAMDAGQILKPALARGELRMVGATTLDEYRQYIEKDKALERRFQPVYVQEPTVQEAITILRGLKEKYEVHHGVRITDPAIVAAVQLSHRYISSRFLPDKAIDLMDEAASKLSIEISSVPVALENIKRRIMELQVEREALKKESDDDSKERLSQIEKDLADLNEESQRFEAQWEKERAVIDELKSSKHRLEELRNEMERSERAGNLERAAEIKYGELPELENTIKTLNEQAEKQQSANESLIKEEVGPDDIAEVVAKWTGIPVQKMLQTESQKLLEMESKLSERVVGQPEALEVVASAIRRSRAEISDPNRPIGTFLFLGPTGVGKTETVKALAEFLFDSEQAIVRIDMSEYMEKHSVARLIGAPPGYVGYEEGGQLTEQVRRRPYSIVLLDEIEKAHPDVFNVLLQLLDDGRLTDGQGRTVDFKNTVVIMTSNLGSQFLVDPALTPAEREEKVMETLGGHFRPEFLNRIDEVVMFKSLSEEMIASIVKIQLEQVRERMKERGVLLSFDDSAISFLAKRGFDPLYGARPLKRTIQTQLLNPLADRLLSQSLVKGDAAIVRATDTGLVIEKAT